MSEALDRVDVAKLMELLKKATPGPWHTNTICEIGCKHPPFTIAQVDTSALACDFNAELICEMRNTISKIIAREEGLKSRIEELEQEVKQQHRLAEGFRQDYANSNRKRDELEERLAAMTWLLREARPLVTDSFIHYSNLKSPARDLVGKIDAALKAVEENKS